MFIKNIVFICVQRIRKRLRIIKDTMANNNLSLTKGGLFILLIILACMLTRITTSTPSGKAIDSSNVTIHADLGQDKTDDDVPAYINEALITASKVARLNQYVPANGEEVLLKAVAALYSKRINRDLKHDKNVFVSTGASAALFASFQALTLPGEEWIIMDPFWPKYKGMLELAHAVPRFVNLKLQNTSGIIDGEDWVLDRVALESAFNNKTKGIVLNNPHNPIGKVFSLEDLQFIAELSEKYNTYVIADEVFEWTVYGPYEFINFASLPGMFNRTISIGSASKSLLLSGWRIGWVYGPEHLINKIILAHYIMLICAPAKEQHAVAHALELELKNLGTPNSFFYNNTRNLLAKKNILTKAFRDAGMTPYMPDSGDCLVVKLPKLKDFSFDFVKNVSQAEWFTNTTGVFGLPMTTFYGDEHAELGKDSMRFCFQKKFETIERAAEMIQILRQYLP